MKITVTDNTSKKKVLMDVNFSHTVGKVAEVAVRSLGLKQDSYFIALGTKRLPLDQSMTSVGIKDGDNLNLISSPKGGGKPRIKTEEVLSNLETVSAKIRSGEKVSEEEIQQIRNDLIQMPDRLIAPVRFPNEEQLTLTLVRSDQLSQLEEYRSDEIKWQSISLTFFGAIIGIIAGALSVPSTNSFSLSTISIFSLLALGIMALITWISAREYGRRAKDLKTKLLIILED